MKITAHCLVKNEARFIWYAVMSVMTHVDKVLLWDTGSTDGTLEIIKEIKNGGEEKVDFRELGEVTAETFANVRQKMLEATETDWFMVVDGDEIWWEDSIKKVTETIGRRGDKIESIVVPTYNLVGDIYHYQEEAAGQYRLAGREGHYNLRAINRKIPGLHWQGPHGQGGWADSGGRMIQDRDPKKIIFLEALYLHTTNLPRARGVGFERLVPKRTKKLKYEIGVPFPADFYYPEVFFRPRPKLVPSPWVKMELGFKLRAAIQTPFKKVKRRILPAKVGY